MTLLSPLLQFLHPPAIPPPSLRPPFLPSSTRGLHLFRLCAPAINNRVDEGRYSQTGPEVPGSLEVEPNQVEKYIQPRLGNQKCFNRGVFVSELWRSSDPFLVKNCPAVMGPKVMVSINCFIQRPRQLKLDPWYLPFRRPFPRPAPALRRSQFS